MKFVPNNQFYQQHKYRIILIVCFEQIITGRRATVCSSEFCVKSCTVKELVGVFYLLILMD